MPVEVPANLHDLDIIDPARFPAWRVGQHSLVSRIANSPKRIIMIEAECGVGKSLIPIAAAAALGARALVMIQTVNLQHQYMRDFSKIGAMALGRSRFTCAVTGQRADWAPCTIGMKCAHKGVWDRETGIPVVEPTCAYYMAKAEAHRASLAVLNYSFWLAESKNSATFKDRDIIICDEAHELDTLCMKAGTAEIVYDDCTTLRLPRPTFTTIAQARDFCKQFYPTVISIRDTLREKLKESGMSFSDDYGSLDDAPEADNATDAMPLMAPRDSDRLRAALRLDSSMSDILAITEPTEWVIDSTAHTRRNVVPIYGKYGFSRILDAIPETYTTLDADGYEIERQGKLILMSAFLAPEKLMGQLGIDPDEVEVITADAGFDRRRSPIIPTPMFKMSYTTKPNEWAYVSDTIALIAAHFSDRPGIIHVPSVDLRNKIYSNLPGLRDRLICYDGRDEKFPRFTGKDEAIDRFKQSSNGILLGQSVTTGLDVPYVPQWQIIVKMPFMSTASPEVAARKLVDKDFYDYYAICQLVQAAGRIKRAPDHDGPTFILDQNFGWFYARHKQQFPKWFRDNVNYSGWSYFDSDASFKIKMRKAAIDNQATMPVSDSRSPSSGGLVVREAPRPLPRPLPRR